MTEKEISGKKKLLKALEKYELSFEEKYPPAEMEVEFSEQYERYIEKLIAGEIPKRRKRRHTVGKRIAACVAAVMIIFGSSMTVKAFREPVVEFFTNVYEKIIEIFFQDDDIAKAPTEIETVYTLGYVPDGYELESFEMNAGKTMAKTVYVNGEDEIIFRQYIFDGKSWLDNENTDYKYISIDNLNVAAIEKNGRINLYWNTDEYSFMLNISIDISEDEYKSILQSVAEKD